MKNEKEPKDEKQAELKEPNLEKAEGGLHGWTPSLEAELADPRPSPIFKPEF